MAIATVNPATGQRVKAYEEMSSADVEGCLAAAAAAHASYRLTSFEARAGWMGQAAGILDGEQDQVAAMMNVLLPGSNAKADAADALAVAVCHAHHRASALRMVVR